MKIWIDTSDNQTHTIIRLNCEQHSNFTYLGDFSDADFQRYLSDLQKDIDTQKNLQLIKYFGYLHLLIKKSG